MPKWKNRKTFGSTSSNAVLTPQITLLGKA